MKPTACLFALLLLLGCTSTNADTQNTNTAKPNVVIFFTDDQGYVDLSCYGNPTIHTPHLDQMAAQGMKLTQFYVASPVCSPSRAALLTGSYPKRVGMHKHVIFPQYDYGLHTDEHTIADMLKAQGYATGMFGKWHLGHRPGLLPTDQGFDTWYGIPYSNDMSTFHRGPKNNYKFNLPLMRGHEVIEWDALRPTRQDMMAASGVVLENAADMARCFPELWESADAARQDRRRSVTNGYYRIFSNSRMSHSSALVTYQPEGAGQKPRRATFDLTCIADPEAWLRERLGPLSMFEIACDVSGSAHAALQPACPDDRLALLARRLDEVARRDLRRRREALNDLAARLASSAPDREHFLHPQQERSAA